MNRITVRNLIKFREKKDRSRENFVIKLLEPKENKKEGNSKGSGGHHWQFSLAAIAKAFKNDDLQVIKNKIVEVGKKLNDDKYGGKNMCVDNLAVLQKFTDYNFRKWKPSNNINILTTSNSVIEIRGIPILVTPHCIFTNDNEIGALWLMGSKDGFSDEERGMYAEALYLALKKDYSHKYTIMTKYCLAVDIVKDFTISYKQLETGNIGKILRPTINEFIKLMP